MGSTSLIVTDSKDDPMYALCRALNIQGYYHNDTMQFIASMPFDNVGLSKNQATDCYVLYLELDGVAHRFEDPVEEFPSRTLVAQLMLLIP